MLDLYEEYASQEEREDAVMLEQAEIQMDRAILALETCDAMEALAMREAECRLVMESGDACDLMEYYEEATEETKDKKEGLLTKIWKNILDFLKKIKETLFGKSEKAEDNKEYEVEKSWLDKHVKIKAAAEAVGKFFANPAIKALTVAIGAIVSVIGIKAIGKKIKLKGRDVNKIVAEEKQATDKVESGIKSFLTKKIGIAQDQVKGFASKVSELTKHMRTSTANFMGLYTKDQLDKAEKKGEVKGWKRGKERFGKDKYLTSAEKRAEQKKASDAMAEIDAEERLDELVQTSSADVEDYGDDIYGEDAGDLSDIAELLSNL